MSAKGKQRKWKLAGINCDHFHMGDLLEMASLHPQLEIVGIQDCQLARMQPIARHLKLPEETLFTDEHRCLEQTQPDLVILCSAPALHARDVERVASLGIHLLVEKPFAVSLAEADRMIAAARKHRVTMAINWPLRWMPSHCTAFRLLVEGRIGELEEVHYYGGNRGPLFHTAGKKEVTPTPALKRASWFYQKAKGGGSLLDYLGYGATLGTWFHGGRKPLEVSTMTCQAKGLAVDEHSITVARYACGLSEFQTRWGTFTDPWTTQPQPQCGFVLKGSDGTISSYDYEPVIRIQTRRRPAVQRLPVDKLQPPFQNPLQYFVDCLNRGRLPEGPLAPAISRIGQQIVDSAALSARSNRTVKLLD
jgi:predicted dehydrogenase